MKKKISSVLLLCLVSLVLCGCGAKNPVPNKSKTEQTKMTLTGMYGVNYYFKPIPENVVTYLKTGSEYKDLYTDKKFTIYYVGADCPYAQAFIDAIDPIKNDAEYSSAYNFYAQEAAGFKQFATMEDAQNDVSFSNLCHEFCVVNPVKDEIFAIDGIGYEEASKIADILEQLKDW